MVERKINNVVSIVILAGVLQLLLEWLYAYIDASNGGSQRAEQYIPWAKLYFFGELVFRIAVWISLGKLVKGWRSSWCKFFVCYGFYNMVEEVHGTPLIFDSIEVIFIIIMLLLGIREYKNHTKCPQGNGN